MLRVKIIKTKIPPVAERQVQDGLQAEEGAAVGQAEDVRRYQDAPKDPGKAEQELRVISLLLAGADGDPEEGQKDREGRP